MCFLKSSPTPEFLWPPCDASPLITCSFPSTGHKEVSDNNSFFTQRKTPMLGRYSLRLESVSRNQRPKPGAKMAMSKSLNSQDLQVLLMAATIKW